VKVDCRLTLNLDTMALMILGKFEKTTSSDPWQDDGGLWNPFQKPVGEMIESELSWASISVRLISLCS
jgi:hypothetical protein